MQKLTTEQALSKLDAASFEALANEVLRYKFPILSSLIVSGLNAQGKTIKGSSDAFCLIENSHYATVHHTTQQDLRKKWIYNGQSTKTPKGDLIKALEAAQKLRTENPNLKVSIFLSTNLRVPETLGQEIQALNTTDSISIEIVEQSIMCSFLNATPTGQYLRRVHLGIETELLSRELLNGLVQNNIDRYKEEMYLNDCVLVPTEAEKNVRFQLNQSTKTINLLVGDSGFGKSSVAYSLVCHAISIGKIALRIAPHIIEQSVSLNDAIVRQLNIEHPGLHASLDSCLLLFAEALVVVDDINKSSAAVTLLDKLISWGEAAPKNKMKLLCPIWNKNLSLIENKVIKEERFSTLGLSRPSYRECAKIVEQGLQQAGVNLTDQQVRSIILDNSMDPLLLGICTKLIGEGKEYSAGIPKEAIGSFVEGKLKIIADKNQQPLFVVKQTVIKFAKALMSNRILEPELLQVNEWFQNLPSEKGIIYQVANDRQLFHFDDEGKCFFRHDRIRNHLLTLSLEADLLNKQVDIALFGNPFFAELIGAALASSPFTPEVVRLLLENNPASVFSSLKFLQGPEKQLQFDHVVEEIQEWYSINDKKIPSAITLDISRLFLSFDTKEIKKLTKGLPDSIDLSLAKFRNGEWLSGVIFFASMRFFTPGSKNYWRDSIIEHVKAKHEGTVIDGLSQSLPNKFTPEGIKHAYALSGFMRSPSLMYPMQESWKAHAKNENYLQYLWAVLNCFSKEHSIILKDAFEYWKQLPDEPNQRSSTKVSKQEICRELRYIRFGITEKQMDPIKEIAVDQDLVPLLAAILAWVDSPAAFEIVLKNKDEKYADMRGERWDFKKTGKRLSQASRDFLLAQSRNFSRSDGERYLAWSYWSTNEETDILIEELKQTDPNDKLLFSKSILLRVSLQDESVLPIYLQLIEKMPTAIRWIHCLWNAVTRSYFRQWLKKVIQSKNEESINDALNQLMAIDNQEAAEIFIEQWNEIKQYHNAIGTALYLSTPATRELARTEINRLGFSFFERFEEFFKCNLESTYIDFEMSNKFTSEELANINFLLESFKYLQFHYGCFYEGIENRITIEKLESLIPYFPLLGQLALLDFAQDCQRLNRMDFCTQYIVPHMGRQVKAKIIPGKDDILSELHEKCHELNSEQGSTITFWTEDLKNRNVPQSMLIKCLMDFGKVKTTQNALRIVCKVLESVGTRKEIPMIEDFQVEESPDMLLIESIKANAVYSIKRNSLQ